MSRLGIDIGGVIISRPPEGEDTAFFGASIEAALATPPFEGLFDWLPSLVERFKGRVWLVSKCGKRIEERSRLWLDHHRFYERTRVPPENVRFCRDRPGKAPICRELGVTHFIDDRLDVLGYLEGVVPHRYLFAPGPETLRPADVTPLSGWRDASLRCG
jgi:hypothetical protein